MATESAAILELPEAHLDMVRVGIIQNGLWPSAEVAHPIALRETMRLFARVVFLKRVHAGESIGYGRAFVARRESVVATLPIGYADGLFRGLSNHMAVQTDQGPAPIRGRICMDMTMVDLSDLPDVHVGDAVELFGQRQRVDDLAAVLGTIPYELTCAVSKRVPRLYTENGEVVERSLRML